MSSRYAAVLSVLGILLAGCDSRAGREPVIGEAYAGPVTLNLRSELAPKSEVTATVKHGERLEILETRRRFIKVRTQQGAEGWTDGHLLLSPEQMDGLRRMAEATVQLPSQGIATIFEPLNMHTETARQSPSFYQIPENAKLDMLAHRLTPRIQNQSNLPPAAAAAKPSVPLAKKPKTKSESTKGDQPPPLPKPPGPPPNWLELSRPPIKRQTPEPVTANVEAVKPKIDQLKAPPEKAAAPMDDWTLVRTRDGKAGWVLSRLLIMALPDEVAQYAEGHRITSYFALGDVHDRGETKHNWLWTTIAKGGQPYEFDSFRVFVWSVRHHRYETAYIEKNLKGYYPVEVSTAPVTGGKVTVDAPAFSIVAEDENGRLYRTKYVFSGYHIRAMSRMPYEQPVELLDLDLRRAGSARQFPGNVAASEQPSWFARGWKSVVDWRRRWFKGGGKSN